MNILISTMLAISLIGHADTSSTKTTKKEKIKSSSEADCSIEGITKSKIEELATAFEESPGIGSVSCRKVSVKKEDLLLVLINPENPSFENGKLPFFLVFRKVGVEWKLHYRYALSESELIKEIDNSLSFDSAPFQLNEAETAFGFRVSHNFFHTGSSGISHNLSLFRLTTSGAEKVFSAEMDSESRRECEDQKNDETTSEKATLEILKTSTLGFNDWQLTVKKTQKNCKGEVRADKAIVQKFVWSGAKYERVNP